MAMILHWLSLIADIFLHNAAKSAYIAPYGIGEGVFEVIFVRGTWRRRMSTVHYGIDPLAHPIAKNDDSELPIPHPTINCLGEGNTEKPLNGTEHGIARSMFSNWCEMYDPHKASLVLSVQGNTTWFLCNYDIAYRDTSKSQHCSRAEICNVSAMLDEECGVDAPGYVMIAEWHKSYGRAAMGEEICRKLPASLGPRQVGRHIVGGSLNMHKYLAPRCHSVNVSDCPLSLPSSG